MIIEQNNNSRFYLKIQDLAYHGPCTVARMKFLPMMLNVYPTKKHLVTIYCSHHYCKNRHIFDWESYAVVFRAQL